MKVCLFCFVTLFGFFPLESKADLGATPATCQALYGELVQSRTSKNVTYNTYSKNNRGTTVSFWQGRAVNVSMRAFKEHCIISNTEAFKILARSGQGSTWKAADYTSVKRKDGKASGFYDPPKKKLFKGYTSFGALEFGYSRMPKGCSIDYNLAATH